MEDHYHHFFLILVCFLSIETTVLFVSAANNPKFIACEPKKCGNSNLTISYPFWIPHEQESYCGHPDFRINCITTTATTIDDDSVYNQPPLVQILNEDYIIRDIFYRNQSFRVTNAKSFNDPCPSPLRNLTFDYVGSPFSFGPNHADLFFFYNCTLVPTDYFTYALPCFTYNNTNGHQYQSFATVIHDGGFQYLNSTSEKCRSMVGAPIEQMELASMMKMDYTDVLRRGFVLQWNSSNCRDCEQSGGRCGFDNNFVCFCQDNTDVRHPKTCKDREKRRKKKIAIGVGGGIGGFILACLCGYLFFYLRRRKNRRSISSNLMSQNISPDSSLKPDPENGSYFATPIFSYKELEEATNNFDSKRELGDGGFGTVYRGELQDGRVVAVKRLYENNFKRVEQFMNEVNILSLLRHENLVTLYGCTSRHSRELLLVYEFVPNGTVADHIHGELARAGLATWPIRMNIAIESAGALKYLHASDIIHRDVKTNNILLDKNFHVKVADFGLSRLFPTDVTHVSTAPQGTPGYVDPEYYQCYQLTDKSDVYSFGVVLIELISSKPAVDISRHRHDINLANMAINKIQNHSLSELVDPSLGFESDSRARRMITLVAELAFRCLQQDRDMRPSMVEVLEVLKGIAGEEDNVVKAVEIIDIPADHDVVRLLKNDTAPFSPISVTDKWGSVASTPNTSS